jgi:N-6 DNA Methylase
MSNPEYRRNIRAHQAWLGYLQPEGLVVSAVALADAGVEVDLRGIETQQRFLSFVQEVERGEQTVNAILDLPSLCLNFLGWPAVALSGLDPARPLPDDLMVALPEVGEMLSPSFALRDPRAKEPASTWLLLVKSLPLGEDMDAVTTGAEALWSASPEQRFERLLRGAGVPIGLLANGTHIRLVYAPRGENAGSLTFPVQAMCETAGRSILSAFHDLLYDRRLIGLGSDQRLPALLRRSREYQATVSTQLAEQVLGALYELLRGFQSADEHARGALLGETLARNPDTVYHGLLNVLLRLVFLLFAEDRALMPLGSLYQQNYSVKGLFERLRADDQHYPDTMDQRYGAWAQLLVVFRAVYAGVAHPKLKMIARRGYLFDPAAYPFLEGILAPVGGRVLPLVSDGVVFRVLNQLIIVEGERVSYRTLGVEEIGSVYTAIMGFNLRTADGPTIAIKPNKPHGAPTPLNLAELREQKPAERVKWLKQQTDQDLSGEAANSLRSATTIEGLMAALDRRIARHATPGIVPAGAMLLVPSDERRRSGSHYTPRTLTEPIVRKTLEPIFRRLGENPLPEQILELKVCDLAMGSAALLVEADRQIAERLVQAWHRHHSVLTIPPDEDELLYARRLVAQRCLYGVDKNPMAVDLAKLSLWLATLARDHPFTFLDHALRAGDSLVGLSRAQIERFDWAGGGSNLLSYVIAKRLGDVLPQRRLILEAGDTLAPEQKYRALEQADKSLAPVRLAGDLAVGAFFAGANPKQRKAEREKRLLRITEYLAFDNAAMVRPEVRAEIDTAARALRGGEHPITPFHWEIEFPEVFDRDNGGFDAFVGNPPFAGVTSLFESTREGYTDWLRVTFPDTGGKCDLVAFFFRRAFQLIREKGCFGLIATNTIGQGDTRYSGLRWICTHGGVIYSARKRLKWPGEAAVVVSVVNVIRGILPAPYDLDGHDAPIITSYLFHAGGHENPSKLRANGSKAFKGAQIYGQGFAFDDADTKGVASSLAEMRTLLEHNPENAKRIFPYIGGEEINESPTQQHSRYVINFGDMTDVQARLWPDLFSIVKNKVLPERKAFGAKVGANRLVESFWQFGHTAKALYSTIALLPRVLANSQVSSYLAFAFLSKGMIYAHTTNVFAFDQFSAFGILQSRIHEVWVRFFASSLEDRLRYAPTDCFETFPFPSAFEQNAALEQAGQAYYDFRAALMVRNNEGMTKIYNRFHNPDEASPDILRLRELHAAMDRAVLDAYGWPDIPTECDFLLDYEDDAEDAGKVSKGRKPWRYRLPDPIRDEVLARLLALNAQRAEEERLAGLAAAPKKAGRQRKLSESQDN